VMARHVRVVPAALGGDVSLAGAYPLVISRLAETLPETTTPESRPGEPAATTARR